MFDRPIRDVIVAFAAIVISITVHEFAHAITADRLGDDTPRRHGRITLNPIVMWQAHPFGALIVPLLGAFSGFLVGWAATPVNPARVRRDITVRKADIMITAAGPISNLLLAVVSLVLFGALMALVRHGGQAWATPLMQLAQMMVLANILLAFFNMIPIPPLDGFGILSAYNNGQGKVVGFLQQYGMLLLLVIFVKGDVIFAPVFYLYAWSVGAVMGIVA